MRLGINNRWLLAAGLAGVMTAVPLALAGNGKDNGPPMFSTIGGTPRAADLFGQNQPVPVATDLFGSADFRLNSGQKRISLELFVGGAEAMITRIHIHDGMAGEDGPVVVSFFDVVADPMLEPIPVGPDGVDLDFLAMDLDRNLVKDIRKNPDQYYLNVHTMAFPGGEIRGQLYKPETVFADLLGENQVPPNDSMGFGTAEVRLNKEGGIVSLFLSVADTFPITRIHIHEGQAGETGPIAITFFEGMDDNPIMVGDGVLLGFQAEGVDEFLIEDILDFPENYYVNVHTTEFPGGEIRGQLLYEDDDMEDMD